jgi:hypothetical protein
VFSGFELKHLKCTCFIQIIISSDPSITDETTLSQAEEIAASKARCDYALMIGASSHNSKIIPQVL